MWSCNRCRGQADKKTDTVKIDFASLARGGDKENVAPQAPSATKHSDAVEKQKQQMREEEERQHRGQEERERLQQEKELKKEKERVLQEQQDQMRPLAEEQQRRLAEEQRIAERQRQLQIEAEQTELRHQEEERQRREEERLHAEAVAKEQQAAKEEKQAKLNRFLASAGFKAVNQRKKTSGLVSSGFTDPLHAAVKANNLEAVQLLLWAGADKAHKDSSRLTPAALAKKLNKKDSHKAILAALGE